MIEFELDIPSLAEEKIQLRRVEFENVRRLKSSSTINDNALIKMPLLYINSYSRRVYTYDTYTIQLINTSIQWCDINNDFEEGTSISAI